MSVRQIASVFAIVAVVTFAQDPQKTKTEAEAKAFEQTQQENASADKHGSTAEQDRDQAYNRLFIDRGSNLERVDGQIRTSLIVDPPDGHVPPRVAGRGGARRAPSPEGAAEEGAARGLGI